MLHAIIERVTNCTDLNCFRAPKCFNLWLSENFCLSQRMQESVDHKARITYMGSIIHGPSGPGPKYFIVGLGHFQRGIGHYTLLACKTLGKDTNIIKSSNATVPDPHHTCRISIYHDSERLISPTHMPDKHIMWYLPDPKHTLLTLDF